MRYGAIYAAVSNQDGKFSFGEIPSGTYVLHVEGGTGHHYDPEDILIEISPDATNNALQLWRVDGGGGSCRSTFLDIQFVRR
jgi:ER membrane protein complex subunit 7-like protein